MLLLIPLLVLIALSPLIARLLAMAVSRQREYLADATAAQYTRNPRGLAEALEKIRDSGMPFQKRAAVLPICSSPIRCAGESTIDKVSSRICSRAIRRSSGESLCFIRWPVCLGFPGQVRRSKTQRLRHFRNSEKPFC